MAFLYDISIVSTSNEIDNTFLSQHLNKKEENPFFFLILHTSNIFCLLWDLLWRFLKRSKKIKVSHDHVIEYLPRKFFPYSFISSSSNASESLLFLGDSLELFDFSDADAATNSFEIPLHNCAIKRGSQFVYHDGTCAVVKSDASIRVLLYDTELFWTSSAEMDTNSEIIGLSLQLMEINGSYMYNMIVLYSFGDLFCYQFSPPQRSQTNASLEPCQLLPKFHWRASDEQMKHASAFAVHTSSGILAISWAPTHSAFSPLTIHKYRGGDGEILPELQLLHQTELATGATPFTEQDFERVLDQGEEGIMHYLQYYSLIGSEFPGLVMSLEFSPDGCFLAALDTEHGVTILTTAADTCSHFLKRDLMVDDTTSPSNDAVCQIGWWDSQTLTTLTKEGELNLTDLATGAKVDHGIGALGRGSAIACPADGETLWVAQRTAVEAFTISCVKKVNAQEAMDLKIAKGELSEALALAQKVNLDTDPVYKALWASSPSSEAVEQYVTQIKDRRWVAELALMLICDSPATLRSLLRESLRVTDSELPNELEARLQLHIELLETYCQLGATSTEVFSGRGFASFRELGVLSSAEIYAQEGKTEALRLLFQRHQDICSAHELSLLSSIPETVSPLQYKDLLPKVVPSHQSRENEVSEDEGTPDLQHWYVNRILEMDDFAGNLDHSYELCGLALEYLGDNVPQLMELRDLISHLKVSVSEGSVDPLLTLQCWISMNSKQKIQALLAALDPETTHTDTLKNLSQIVHGPRPLPFKTASPQQLVETSSKEPDYLLWEMEIVSVLVDLVLESPESGFKKAIAIAEASKPSLPLAQRILSNEKVLLSMALETSYCPDIALKCGLDSLWSLFECLPARKSGMGAEYDALQDRVDILEKHLITMDILKKYGIRIPGPLALKDKDGEYGSKMVKKICLITGRRTTYQQGNEIWVDLFSDCCVLKNKAFPDIKEGVVERSVLEGALANEQIDLAKRILRICTETGVLSKAEMEEIILKASQHFLNSAASVMSREVEVALEIVGLLGEDVDKALKAEQELLASLMLIRLLGSDVPPLQIRLSKDSLDILQRILAANPQAYLVGKDNRDPEKEEYGHTVFQLAELLNVTQAERFFLHVLTAQQALLDSSFSACATICCDLLLEKGSADPKAEKLLFQTVRQLVIGEDSLKPEIKSKLCSLSLMRCDLNDLSLREEVLDMYQTSERLHEFKKVAECFRQESSDSVIKDANVLEQILLSWYEDQPNPCSLRESLLLQLQCQQVYSETDTEEDLTKRSRLADMALCLLAEQDLMTVLKSSAGRTTGFGPPILTGVEDFLSLSTARLLMVKDIEEVGNTLKYILEQIQSLSESPDNLPKLESMQSTSTDEVVVPDESIVEQVMQMGFSSNGAWRAVTATKNRSMEEALAWAISHAQDAEFNAPLPQPKLLATPSSVGQTKAFSRMEAKFKVTSQYLLLLRKLGTVESDVVTRKGYVEASPRLLFELSNSHSLIKNSEADCCVELLDLIMAGSKKQQNDALLKRLENSFPTIDVMEFCKSQMYRQDFLEVTVCCDNQQVLELAREACRTFDASEYGVVASHLEWWLTDYADSRMQLAEESFLPVETTQLICKALTGSPKYLAGMGSSETSEGSIHQYLLQKPEVFLEKLGKIYDKTNGCRLVVINLVCRLMLDCEQCTLDGKQSGARQKALNNHINLLRRLCKLNFPGLNYKALMGKDLFPEEKELGNLKEGALVEISRVVTLESAGAFAKLAQRMRGVLAQDVYLAAVIKGLKDARLASSDTFSEEEQDELAVLDNYITNQVVALMPKLNIPGVIQVARQVTLPVAKDGEGWGQLSVASRLKILEEASCLVDGKEGYNSERCDIKSLQLLTKAIEQAQDFGSDLQEAHLDITLQAQVLTKSVVSGKPFTFVANLCDWLKQAAETRTCAKEVDVQKLDTCTMYVSAVNDLLTGIVSVLSANREESLEDGWEEIKSKLHKLRRILDSATKKEKNVEEDPSHCSLSKMQMHICQELQTLLEHFCEDSNAHEWNLDKVPLTIAVRLRSDVMEILREIGWLGEQTVPDLYYEVAEIVAQGFSRKVLPSDLATWESTQQVISELITSASEQAHFEYLGQILWVIAEREIPKKFEIVKQNKMKLVLNEILNQNNSCSWDPRFLCPGKIGLGGLWMKMIEKAWNLSYHDFCLSSLLNEGTGFLEQSDEEDIWSFIEQSSRVDILLKVFFASQYPLSLEKAVEYIQQMDESSILSILDSKLIDITIHSGALTRVLKNEIWRKKIVQHIGEQIRYTKANRSLQSIPLVIASLMVNDYLSDAISLIFEFMGTSKCLRTFSGGLSLVRSEFQNGIFPGLFDDCADEEQNFPAEAVIGVKGLWEKVCTAVGERIQYRTSLK